ncbi:hypothetical protein ABE10_02555, partial [Bacillus toyonensis]|nr:hypothetical protein [Bacillus toyonensis]
PLHERDGPIQPPLRRPGGLGDGRGGAGGVRGDGRSPAAGTGRGGELGTRRRGDVHPLQPCAGDPPPGLAVPGA